MRLRRRWRGARAPGLFDSQDEVTDVNFVGVLNHQWTGDLSPIDVGPVGALEVDNDELAVLENDASVPLGHVSLGKNNVVALHPSNGYFSFVEIEAALVPALLGQRNRKHLGLPDALPSTP